MPGQVQFHIQAPELRMSSNKLTFDKSIEHYKRGSIIYREGSRINGCYCIQKGIVKVYKTGIDGKEQIIRFARREILLVSGLY